MWLSGWVICTWGLVSIKWVFFGNMRYLMITDQIYRKWTKIPFSYSADTAEFEFLKNFRQKLIFSWFFYHDFCKKKLKKIDIFEVFDHFLNFFMIMTIFDRKYIKNNHENNISIKKSLILIIFWKNFACGAENRKTSVIPAGRVLPTA